MCVDCDKSEDFANSIMNAWQALGLPHRADNVAATLATIKAQNHPGANA